METRQQHPELPESLLTSKGQSCIAGIEFTWCAPEEIPEPYHRLLVHDHDMTSALEGFHDAAITLEIRQARQEKGEYLREVILHAAGSNVPVEYGLIEIELEAFKPAVRAAIVEGGQPLGGLLNDTGMHYRSAPLGYFRVPAEALAAIFSASSGGAELFGRYNQLIAEDGTRLARIIEILPIAPAQ